MTKPISPSQIAAHKAKSFPAYVFDAVNDLLASEFSNGSATIKQKHIIDRMLEKANKDISNEEIDDEFGGYGSSLTKDKIFSRGYLNFEEVYREAGWEVSYDKPAYNETYDASFKFKEKK